MKMLQETRESLKCDILDWVRQFTTDRRGWIKALEVVKSAAFEAPVTVCSEMIEANARFFEDAGCPFSEGDEVIYSLTLNFSPRHYPTLMGFVQRYEAIQEAEWEAADAIATAVEAEEITFDDDVIYEVDAYVIVYGDHLEFVANQPGYGDRLPRKGRKYIGNRDDIRWSFPLSALAELRRVADLVLDGKGNKV